MTSTQITKLAAAGLTVEQIAVVAEVMEYDPVFWEASIKRAEEKLKAGYFHRDGLLMHDLVLRERTEDRIETKVQHGELTVWPEKPKAEVNDYGFRSAQQTER